LEWAEKTEKEFDDPEEFKKLMMDDSEYFNYEAVRQNINGDKYSDEAKKFL
jgi:hypothetical protein